MAYQIEFSQGAAIFTIDRPAFRNAVNFEVMEGLEKFIAQVEKDETVWVAIIRGSGDRAFCSGGDLSEFHTLRTAEEAYPMLARMAENLYKLSVLPVPVVAVIDGAAVGGGCEIATACDYRIVSEKARAGFIQGTLAITSGWGGATQLIEKMGRKDQALKFLCEAAVHDAETLLEIGWATEMYQGSAEQGIDGFLARMSGVHPSVHRAYKSIVADSLKKTASKERMMEEARRCAELWESEAHHEAVSKFLSKKKRNAQ